jgi:O-antigen ligase
MFGGVYLWCAVILAAAVVALGVATRARDAWPAPSGWLRRLDHALGASLAVVVLQLIPLPAGLVRLTSPAREHFLMATALQSGPMPAWLPLTIDPAATFHAFLSLFAVLISFWIARAVFARGGLRTFSTIIAWGAIGLVILTFAQHASGTTLVYGFWPPRDAGARPLGPFINRNHLGTWSLLAICLCAGYLQWRTTHVAVLPTWRARLAAWMDGRRLVLQLAIVLLAAVLALGASRSSLVALLCAAGYVAVAGLARAPSQVPSPRRPASASRISLSGLAAMAIVAMLGYGDGSRLLQRMDETRTTGMANRLAIWRDTVPMTIDYPLTGVGAGAFATAMQLYQTSPRTYFHNEAHNQYVQIAAEGGLLLAVPAAFALAAFVGAARLQLRRRDDPLRWMRVAGAAALIGVAVQSIWETGLTVPANGMFAAVLAGLVVHQERR